jgi:hypothetical protein
MSADLIHIGDQVGLAPRMSAATPAMCGLDIEVPELVLNRFPAWFGGATAAMTSTPGAVMSGFRTSPPPAIAGPREENAAISGARAVTVDDADSEAVAPAVAAYALIASPAADCTCTVGTKWKSALSVLSGLL